MGKVQRRILRLNSRRTDKATGRILLKESRLSKSISDIDSSEGALQYINENLNEVDPNYTEKTFDECDRVQAQLEKSFSNLKMDVSFNHQGSVTSDTHIRLYSDIDLLVTIEKFITLKAPLVADNPYKGDPIEDMSALRLAIEETLSGAYPKAKVDTAGPRSVSIEGGSLERKIDVVPSNWYDTQEYKNTGDKTFRGVQIFNKNTRERIPNFPFLHNKLIEEKNIATKKRLKPLIRLVKAIRSDSDESIEINSYNLASLCFNIPTEMLNQGSGSGSDLLLIFCKYINSIYSDRTYRESLSVPNKTRVLFDGSLDLNELLTLSEECLELVQIVVNT